MIPSDDPDGGAATEREDRPARSSVSEQPQRITHPAKSSVSKQSEASPPIPSQVLGAGEAMSDE
jgi:hypothetical protein